MSEPCDVCAKFAPRHLPCPLHAKTEAERKRGLEEVIGDAINDGRSDVAQALVWAVYGKENSGNAQAILEIRDDPFEGVERAIKAHDFALDFLCRCGKRR